MCGVFFRESTSQYDTKDSNFKTFKSLLEKAWKHKDPEFVCSRGIGTIAGISGAWEYMPALGNFSRWTGETLDGPESGVLQERCKKASVLVWSLVKDKSISDSIWDAMVLLAVLCDDICEAVGQERPSYHLQ